MSQDFYVRDTSASRRNREIYSTRWTAGECHDNNNSPNDSRMRVTSSPYDYYHRGEMRIDPRPKWDQLSEDSGFSSDLERKVAQLSIAGSDVGSVDENVCEAIIKDDVRAPSRAKLSQEEKRKRIKTRTLPPPGKATRWYRCDDVTEDYSDVDDDIDDVPSNLKMGDFFIRPLERKSKTLPTRAEESHRTIAFENVNLEDLRHLRVLGGGGYARVDLVDIRRCPGHKFALKKLNKRLLQERNQVDHVISEKETMFQARSRFIPRLFRTFQSQHHVYMLTEACLGGDLFSVLENHGALPNVVTRYVIACIIEALDHLHRVLNVIHRDVKTENILIDTKGVAKLADLGFCKRLSHSCDVTHTFCGTPGYVAPEILLRTGHGSSCDFFSAGVVMFETATCRSPFRRHSSIETHKATLRGIKDVAFPSSVDHVTIQTIRSLCSSDPQQRLGAMGCEQVRRHEYFRGFDWLQFRQGRMTSPLLNYVTPNLQDRTNLNNARDDYLDNHEYISRPPYDNRWSENF